MKQGLEKKKLKEELSKKILSYFKKNKFNSSGMTNMPEIYQLQLNLW